MADQPVVVVRGEAVREVPPEIARFSVTVAARDKERQTALTRLAERARQLRSVLDQAGAAIERRETGGVNLRPESKRTGERIVAYTGSVSTTVTVSDFTVLGELMLSLAEQEQTSVAGPWWELRPGSAAGAEVRRAAIADAVDRAREYADAVGAHLERLVEIADEGAAQAAPTRMVAYGMPAAAPRETLELDIDPQPQLVQASVLVRFTISEPTVLKVAEPTPPRAAP